MLILSRQQDEEIVIHINGTVIATLLVSELKPGKVKLGCKAQGNIGIDRKEVFEMIHPGALAVHDTLAK